VQKNCLGLILEAGECAAPGSVLRTASSGGGHTLMWRGLHAFRNGREGPSIDAELSTGVGCRPRSKVQLNVFLRHNTTHMCQEFFVILIRFLFVPHAPCN